tara:strand:+ start:1746 stop:2069 length:324 start_codon:yes stop_codon:yes gene_type:complete
MDEDDKIDAHRISEEVQHAVEFYVMHTSRSMQTIIGKTLIANAMGNILVEKQLDQCKERLKENNLPTETDIDQGFAFLPDVRDYIEAGRRALEGITDMEFMEKYRKH